MKSSLWIKRCEKCNSRLLHIVAYSKIILVVSIRLKQVMKEDNEYYSATKESLRKTINELRETVSHIYYKLIVCNEEKMQT